MPYASHQRIRIHYQIDGEGPALVLHHGLGGSLEVWRQLGYAAALRDNYKVIMLDARGHGASDKPHDRRAYGLLNQVADVLAVLDALHLPKAHFLGYSMGGYRTWLGEVCAGAVGVPGHGRHTPLCRPELCGRVRATGWW